jgi:hypothetical protein
LLWLIRATRRGAERALAEREAAATERLAEMFAGGQEAASVSDRTAPLRSSLAQAQGEERQARAALGKLESDLAAARQQLIRREHAVAICALEVLLDLAAEGCGHVYPPRPAARAARGPRPFGPAADRNCSAAERFR